MARMSRFILAAAVLVAAASVAGAAPPGSYSPGYVSPPSSYHYPSARDFFSPANRTTSNYFVPPQSYYLHPSNAEPFYTPRYLPRSTTPRSIADLAAPDVPLVPRALREPEAPLPATAEIEVRVPADAELWFNGAKTRRTGAVRVFESPPLEPGANYTYDVKARWTEDGQEVERTLRVPVAAGVRKSVTFKK
jgi:uncharacterized protein (TIGR03000 family)